MAAFRCLAVVLTVLVAAPPATRGDQATFGPYGCASVDDDATCEKGVAVSVLGDASTALAGPYEPSAAVSVLGAARGGTAAVALVGEAASPGSVAVSALGPAEGWWAVSVWGPAHGAWAATVVGDAEGDFLGVSVLGHATASDCALLDASPATLPCAAASVLGHARGPVAVSACNLHTATCAG